MTTTSKPSIAEGDARALLTYMRAETEARNQLADRLEALQPDLVKGSADRINQHFEATAPLLRRLEDLARHRDRLVSKVVGSLGLRNVVVKLQALVEIAPEGLQHELQEARAELRNALQRMTEANRRNSLVTRTALSFNQSVVRSAFGAESSTQLYDRSAASHDPAPVTSYLDQEL